MEQFVDDHYEQVDWFINNYILELVVWIPFLENRIRSYRLYKRDIQAMSAKGYWVFDGDKGRFVKEVSPKAICRFK